MKHYFIYVVSVLLFSCGLTIQKERTLLGSISKSPCIEYCNVYDLHLYSDGAFVYVGDVNSTIGGTHEGKLSEKELIYIKELFSKLPKNNSLIKNIDVPAISIKHQNIVTRHKFDSFEFIAYQNFVENLYDRIP